MTEEKLSMKEYLSLLQNTPLLTTELMKGPVFAFGETVFRSGCCA